MSDGSRIKSITALQAWSWRGHPALEARVLTENGALGVAQVQAGTSVGQHEVQFIHDGGPRWGGLGVQKAVALVRDRETFEALTAAQRAIWERLTEHLGEFIRKNDHRFRHESWGVEADAWLRALATLVGSKPSREER